MLATLVIGLREGLEAALIVGIIAAFLARQRQRRALVWMWAGVAVAVIVCVAVALTLEVISADLPQRAQEGLETVIGVIAIAMVTYMIVWMRQHAQHLKAELETAATGAVRSGSATALATMAMLAVLREGLETSVFLVAAFNASHNAGPAAIGALIGIAIALSLGYGIYRGGVHLNLAKFFRITGLLLVLVAAGLTMTALRTAHEAGWLNTGQRQVADLSWLIQPGSIRSSLVTGVLGLQPRPALIEAVGWCVYVVIVGTVVLWPREKAFPKRLFGIGTAVVAAASLAGAVTMVATAPPEPTPPDATLSVPAQPPAVGTGILAGHRITAPANVRVQVTADNRASLIASGTTTGLGVLNSPDDDDVHGLTAQTYSLLASPAIGVDVFVPDTPRFASLADIIAANAGRTPVGLNTRTFGAAAPLVYAVSASVSLTLDPFFHRPLQAVVSWTVTTTSTPHSGAATVLGKVATISNARVATAADVAAIAAGHRQSETHHSRGVVIPLALTVLAVIASVVAAFIIRWPYRERPKTSSDSDAAISAASPHNTKEVDQ